MSEQNTSPGTEVERVSEVEEPIPNPGMPEHLPRPTDISERAEKRAERQVATLFVLSAVFAVLFCVAYFSFDIGEDPDLLGNFGASNFTLGLCLGLSMLCIGVGIIQWGRKLMVDHEVVEERHPIRSSDEDREEAVGMIMQGIEESGIGRRPLIRNTLIGAMAALGLPAIVALRDLGPLPGDSLYHTLWTKGMRVVQDVDGQPLRPSDIRVGDLVNGDAAIMFEHDEHGKHVVENHHAEKAKSAVIVVRMHPDDVTPWEGRENWGIDGILVYSKICTHVGCPIALWEQQTHHLLCPCHQSTFDLADNGRVVFGPAARALPQLPIELDDEGYLVAQSDFTEPVGPSFWERG